jgi:malate dehydrogenase (oxaloacetate-decarboxylating)(NADP+)
MNEIFKQQALDYHAKPKPGKIGIEVTKSTLTQHDLALAYSPGVAEPVREITKKPNDAYKYTNKSNLVAVITNGSAVLGLGNVGALASKPVMEGKALLFKRFADVDVFDIEVDCSSPEDFVNTVVRISPTFGGINLEDIKAPECFSIEQALIERLNIPVFHDDQHGTAIIVAAGLLNALKIQGKTLPEAKIVCVGAGAAGIASMQLLIAMGAKRDNIYLIDRTGIIHSGRTDLNIYKYAFAADTDMRTLKDVLPIADVFIGVSGPGILTPELLKLMPPKPVIFALANPDPEILPKDALAVRDDIIMGTGRSDFPNQVNNVLGFPFIFRGALDARATKINIEMQIAAAVALKEIAEEPVPEEVKALYPNEDLVFGPNYIIPKPFDPRLKTRISQAVAQAAVDTGVAQCDLVFSD